MKKYLKMFVLCGLAVMLTGCFKYRITLDVNKDGTVSGVSETLLQDSMLSIGGTDSDAAVQSMIDAQKKNYPDSEITAVSEGEGDELYKGFRMTNIPTSEYDVTVENNVVTFKVQLFNVMNSLNSMANQAGQKMSLDDLKKAGTEIMMTINMPAKVESANIGTVDGKTVTVDLLSDYGTDDELVITCKLFNRNIVLYIGAGIAVLLVIWLLISRNKDQA